MSSLPLHLKLKLVITAIDTHTHTQVYLQYVDQVTKQRLLVVSSTDQLIAQRHHLKLMSRSENTQTHRQEVVNVVLEVVLVVLIGI